MAIEATSPGGPSAGWSAARLARQVELALASVDLSIAQYRALMQLAQATEASSALADKLAVSPPTLTTVIEGLVQRGAVERTHSTTDRRRISLTVTASGRELLVAGEDAVTARLESIAGELGPVGAKAALDALALWSEALDRSRERRRAERSAVASVAR